ncbi:SLAM family member 8-like [Hyperolius riggenbachi]|uniref:SLAM family member 8-like n=1 Tax=Hyperolius riggenbachi TaxID=752182 RepID=UPI0035A286B6
MQVHFFVRIIMLAGRKELFFYLAYFALVFPRKTELPGQVTVAGLLHQSIELSNYIMLQLPVEEVDWHFKHSGSSRTHKIASFENNQQKIYPPELITRLEILNNGTTLNISDLRIEDSGQYTAYIRLTDRSIQQANLLLTVYDPVPTPSLSIEYKNETSYQCNMTLHCSVPANISGLSYSWKYRRRDSDYQLFNSTGDTIQMSLQSESWDFLCTVYNPADHKDVLMQAMCDSGDVGASRWYFGLFGILCAIPFIMILSGIILKQRRNAKTLEHHIFRRMNNEQVQEQVQPATEDQGLQQDVELLEYCTPTFHTNGPATTSSRNFSWKEIKDHEIPAPQKFETLYAKLEVK